MKKICKYNIIPQKYIVGYYVDAYIKELNLVIEYDENYHLNKNAKLEDQKRENNIILDKACIIYRIKEDDWKNRKEYILENFKLLIQEIEYMYEM